MKEPRTDEQEQVGAAPATTREDRVRRTVMQLVLEAEQREATPSRLGLHRTLHAVAAEALRCGGPAFPHERQAVDAAVRDLATAAWTALQRRSERRWNASQVADLYLAVPAESSIAIEAGRGRDGWQLAVAQIAGAVMLAATGDRHEHERMATVNLALLVGLCAHALVFLPGA